MAVAAVTLYAVTVTRLITPDAVLYLGTVDILRLYRGPHLAWSAANPSSRWKQHAACRGVPTEILVPEPDTLDPATTTMILELCGACPVRRKCGSYGRATNSMGWWGGVLLHFGQPIQNTWRPAPTVVTETERARRKISPQQAEEIRARWSAKGVTQTQLAEEFGISIPYVNNIISGKIVVVSRGLHKLTDSDIAEIRRRYRAGGVLQQELADEFGIGRRTVSQIVGTGIGNRNAAKTHCPSGHEYTPENTYIIPTTGSRACRACLRKKRKR